MPPGKTVWEADAEGTYPMSLGLAADRGNFKKVAGMPPLTELCQSLLGGGVEAVEAIAFPVFGLILAAAIGAAWFALH